MSVYLGRYRHLLHVRCATFLVIALIDIKSDPTAAGHVAKLAEAVKAGVESAGGKVEILQVAETLPQEVLTKMHAPAKPAYKTVQPADLLEYDAFLFGVPTRYGEHPSIRPHPMWID